MLSRRGAESAALPVYPPPTKARYSALALTLPPGAERAAHHPVPLYGSAVFRPARVLPPGA